MTRPEVSTYRGSSGVGSDQEVFESHRSSWVGPRDLQISRVGSGRVGSGRVGSGRVGSGRVGSGRVGSGRVARFSKSHGSHRVRSGGSHSSGPVGSSV